MPYSRGASDDVLTNAKWLKSGMETHGSAILFSSRHPQGASLGIFKNLPPSSGRCEHAEDVFIRTLKEHKMGLMVPGLEVNTIVLNISKSPCSSTYGTSNKAEGCAEALIKFQNEKYQYEGIDYYFKLIVIARGVYRQAQGSHDALSMMQAHGIDVTTDAHRKKNGEPARKEYVQS